MNIELMHAERTSAHKMDISTMCRSCMKQVTSWEKENCSDNEVMNMFMLCTNIKVNEEDKLPKQFCYDCSIKIKSSHKFIEEAVKVDVTLKNIASHPNTSVIVKHDCKNPIRTILDQSNQMTYNLTLPECKTSHRVEGTERQVSFPVIENRVPDQNDIIIENSLENLEENYINQTDLEEKNSNVGTKKEVKTKSNVCPVCHKGFVSKVWFDKHIDKEHTGQKYACGHCPKTFSKRSQLSAHSTSHSEERKFPCAQCGKRFKRRKQLTVHARAHTDVRPYACDKCHMRFKIKSILKCHMKLHDNQKEYLCYFCGWSFAQASNLRAHMRRHTGEKPFACGACAFRAAAASSLRRHERRHAAARTHVCAHCRKGFYDAGALTRHVRTHTGELPYRCPGCARAFSDSWKRKRHLMLAHRLPLHDIPRMRRNGEALQPANSQSQ